MSNRLRIWLYSLSAALFGAILLWGMAGLPDFGHYQGPYGDLVMQTILPLRHTQQGVCAITFDYRGFDTLGEEFILFAAVAGSMLLTRPQQTEQTRERMDQASDRRLPEPGPALIGAGVLMFPFTLLLGMYVVLHGHLTPGGGFQGGALLASAFYFVYLSAEYDDLLQFVEGHAVSLVKVAGAGGFALLAALPLCTGNSSLSNILPLGEPGQLFSAGTLPLLNLLVGIEVAAGFLLLISAFLRQVLIIRKGKPS
jgi:multicomponent Na+:H+ antiporter subunit B